MDPEPAPVEVVEQPPPAPPTVSSTPAFHPPEPIGFTSVLPKAREPAKERRPPGSGARACQRCRRNKSKCVIEGSSSVCRRCEEARMDCIFVNPPTPNFSLATGYINGSDFASTVGDTARVPVAGKAQVEYHSPALGRRPARVDGGPSDSKDFEYGDGGFNDDSFSDASGIQGASSSNRPMRNTGKRADMGDDSEEYGDFVRLKRESSVAAESGPRFIAAGKRRRIDDGHAMISPVTQYEPSLHQQQFAFDVFTRNYQHLVPFVDADKPDSIRHQSQVLYWSIIAVGSRQSEELASTYAFARRKALDCARSTFGGRAPSLDDLKGVVVAHVWLTSIRPIGHLVSLAYELNIHLAHLNLKGRSSAATRSAAKLWAFIVVEDFLASFASGRPCLVAKNDVVSQCEALIRQPNCHARDFFLLAQAELVIITNNGMPQTTFEWGCADDYRLLQKTNANLDEWDVKWRDWAAKATAGNSTSPLATIELHYLFAKVCANTVVLRGIRRTSEVTQHRLIYAYLAVTHAQQLLRVAVSYLQGPLIAYTSEYTQFQITFCAYFLLKVIRLLPSSFEVASVFADIRDVIELLSQLRNKLHAKGLQVIYNFVEKNVVSSTENGFAQTTPAVTKAMADVGLMRGWEESTTASWMADSATGDFVATLFNPWNSSSSGEE